MSFEVIIPHHSRAGLLRRVLNALRAQTEPVDVCVVDNGSSDDSAAVVASEYSEVRLVRLATNLGFGAACNRGIATSRAEHVILLNNDAVPEATFVAELRRAQGNAGLADMLSPCLLQPSGSVDSYGIACDANFNMFDVARGCPYDSLLTGHAPRAFAPSGGAALYARDAVIAVGGFDERIFAYLEDVDLGFRLWLAGSRWGGAARARAVHAHSATLGSGSGRKNYLLAQSKLYLLRKYRHALAPGTIARAALTEAIVSVGKAVTDHNGGALRGWVGAAGGQVDPVGTVRGSLDELLEPRSLSDGICVRRRARGSAPRPNPIFPRAGD